MDIPVDLSSLRKVVVYARNECLRNDWRDVEVDRLVKECRPKNLVDVKREGGEVDSFGKGTDERRPRLRTSDSEELHGDIERTG